MNSTPPAPKGPALPAGMLEATFPFYLHWDLELRLCSAGRSLVKAMPEASVGTSIRDLFHLRRPVGEMGHELFSQDGSLLFLLESVRNGMMLRGQILELENGAGYLMLATPWIADPQEIERLGLTLGDFAVHDQTMDMLQVVQTHRMAIDDLKQLNAKLTEQRARLQEQRAEARKLALVAARTDNAVIISDASGRIEWTNEGFTRLTGWTLEEVRGRTPGSLLQGPDTDSATVDLMRENLRRGEGFQTEIVNYSKNGRRYWVSVEVQPMHDEHGNLQNFMAVEADITERRLSEQRRALQLAVSKLLTGRPTVDEGLAAVLEAICSILNWTVGNAWRRDHASDLLRFEKSWQQPAALVGGFVDHSRELTFKPGAGLPGRVWLTKTGHWVPNVVQDSNFPHAAHAASAGLHAGLALPIITEGEVWGVLEFFNSSIEEPDHKLLETLTGIGGVIGQFVVRKEAEEALRESKELAEAANRAKSDFLATMSHEIRTPMNGVLGFAQLLAQSSLSDEQRDFVYSIRRSAEALLRIINDVLDFSKIESWRMKVEEHPFSIQLCIEDALETVSAVALEKDLDLAGRISPAVPYSLVGDSHRLRQILINLLGNAVKFTPSGEVRLEVDATPDEEGRFMVGFTITDTGIGIQQDRLGELFEPFHQGDSSTSRRFGGTGLGLAISRKLVELMGGRISVSSQLGKGSQFRFELPMAASDQPPSIIDPLPFPDFSGLHFLVVDPHEWTRKVICELLERWGMQVRSAASAEQAREAILDWKPGVILMDDSVAVVESGAALVRENRQSSIFLICHPGNNRDLRMRFGEAIAGLFTKPLKVSLLFNMLLEKIVGKGAARPLVATGPVAGNEEQCGLKVLLAEDNAINRKLALALLSQAGCVPDIAIDGLEAVERATSQRYDVILMDVQMPGMDGLEATHRIRKWEQANGAPRSRIIALTANALAGDRDICIEAGMDDYLAKPLHFQTLREMLLRSRRKVAPAPAAGQSAASRALQQLAGELSPDDVQLLATEFMEDLDSQLARIQGALELGNLDDARRHAHSLKGSSSIFALEVLRGAASEVENACASGDRDAACSLMPALKVAAKEAAAELDAGIRAITVNRVFERMS